ncbi:MATH domain and coiled-coil domain-containing protein At3g58270 [Cajanus cajan]|uniref:MATH domain and coiled-coil domain-containing protein At3g58270 n=1 Tax=Cajanus cajan TaxID=3821 RepID=UPI00098DBDCB|nr:MATH domain and coiled-coil domain-containing protein At3g58270 [Cajanus cajan]
MNLVETQHKFSGGKDYDWGFTSFIPLNKFYDASIGFIVNDTCVIEVEISDNKPEHLNQVVQSICKVDNKPLEHTAGPLAKEMFTTSLDELVDFKGLGKIEKAFVPLLEEVCSQHSSLIDSQRKRTVMFSEYAFRALGRVLHFLKTNKVKDMDGDACNNLQNLWDELEAFGFDLTWLKPHVQSALHMKQHFKKAVQVKRKLEENMAALEIEAEKLKAKITEIEVQLEISSKVLVKAVEAIEVCNLDVELGYGIGAP